MSDRYDAYDFSDELAKRYKSLYDIIEQVPTGLPIDYAFIALERFDFLMELPEAKEKLSHGKLLERVNFFAKKIFES